MQSLSVKGYSCFVFLCLCAACFGIFARFYQLGISDLAWDEYYFTKSVLNILNYGLPRFEYGGYYTRGILQQYLTAPLVAGLPSTELAVRIIPAICGVVALLGIYKLAQELFDANAGLLALAFMSLCLLDIEFSRFARMYAPFHCLFVWQSYGLICFCRYRTRSSFIGTALLAALSIFVYEGAVFSIASFALIFLILPETLSVKRGAFLGVITVAYLALNLVSFRRLGATPHLPAETNPISGQSRLPLELPYADLLSSDGFILVLFLLSGLLTFRFTKKWGNGGFLRLLFIWVMVVALLFHQFALAVVLYAIGLLLKQMPHPSKLTYEFWAVLLASLCFWVTIGLFVKSVPSYELMKMFLGYPDVYNKVVRPWFLAVPVHTVFLILAMCAAFVMSLRAKGLRYVRILCGLLIFQLLVYSIIRTDYFHPRYTYFLHPICIAILAALASFLWSNNTFPRLRKSAVALYVFLFFYCSEVFDVQHLTSVASANTTFRVDYRRSLEHFYYPRDPFKAASSYVNKVYQEGDLVLTAVPVTDYYLDVPFLVYRDETLSEYSILTANYGRNHIWSGKPLVSSLDAFVNVSSATPKSIHIIVRTSHYPWRSLAEAWLADCFVDHSKLEVIDKSFRVITITHDVLKARHMDRGQGDHACIDPELLSSD